MRRRPSQPASSISRFRFEAGATIPTLSPGRSARGLIRGFWEAEDILIVVIPSEARDLQSAARCRSLASLGMTTHKCRSCSVRCSKLNLKRRILRGRRESPYPSDKLDSPSAQSARLQAQSPLPEKRRAHSQSQRPPMRTIPCRKTVSLPRPARTGGSRFHSRRAPLHTPHSCLAETAAASRSVRPAAAIHPESFRRILRSADSPSRLLSPLLLPTSSQSTIGRRRPAGPYPSRTQTWSLAGRLPCLFWGQRAGRSSVQRPCESQLPFCSFENKSPLPH